MLGPAGPIVNTWTKSLARGVSDASVALRSVPGTDVFPLHKLGFGLSMVLDPRVSTLLEVLGDDPERQADTIAWFLGRCTDDELEQLRNTFIDAVLRRST